VNAAEPLAGQTWELGWWCDNLAIGCSRCFRRAGILQMVRGGNVLADVSSAVSNQSFSYLVFCDHLPAQEV
jgi:hypothetical protein